MRNYHLITVPKDAPETDDYRKAVLALLGQHKCKVVEDARWGSRRLFHPMAHEQSGHYMFVDCQTDATQIKEITHDLNILPGVLRFMIARADGK